MRIAVLNKDRCKPKDCNYLCFRICPKVKTGDEAIVIDEKTSQPVISEVLCTGCGICVKRCPYKAITIINLPEELGSPVHKYGKNGFRLYNLPTPIAGVIGIIGRNALGKTTAMKILSGQLKPNLGKEEAEWEEIIERFKGTEMQSYFEKLKDKKIKVVYKIQNVDLIARHLKGKVKAILENSDEKGNLDEIVEKLELKNTLGKKINELSGGELQKVAIAASLTKEADLYIFDEPSSYLDVKERLRVARIIREELATKQVLVVEHDLIVLDYLSDYIHVSFGKPGAYGIISSRKSVRVGINEYLSGFLKAENMRFRDEEIKFQLLAEKDEVLEEKLLSYPKLEKKYPKFSLSVEEGEIFKREILGILGSNATGKTTFMKMLAGVIKPDNLKLDFDVKISYKPQYIKPVEKKVRDLKLNPKLIEAFDLAYLLDSSLTELSGGELQKVAITECLSKEADIYLLDEPSAYLDIEERLFLAKYLKRFCHEKEVAAIVIEHDLSLLDYLSDRILVFLGIPGKEGKASKPLKLRDGMNLFLKEMNITFRRDKDTLRPRANKPGSVKDREQKEKGEYYYMF